MELAIRDEEIAQLKSRIQQASVEEMEKQMRELQAKHDEELAQLRAQLLQATAVVSKSPAVAQSAVLLSLCYAER